MNSYHFLLLLALLDLIAFQLSPFLEGVIANTTIANDTSKNKNNFNLYILSLYVLATPDLNWEFLISICFADSIKWGFVLFFISSTVKGTLAIFIFLISGDATSSSLSACRVLGFDAFDRPTPPASSIGF